MGCLFLHTQENRFQFSCSEIICYPCLAFCIKLITSWQGVIQSEFSENFFSEVMEMFSLDWHNSEQLPAPMKQCHGEP